MQDIDDHIHDLFRSLAPPPPFGDRRPAIRAAARRWRHRRRAGLLAAAVAVGTAGILAITSTEGHQTVTADGPKGDRSERALQITVPGIASPIRVSRTARPVDGYDSFGSIPLADGAITGAVETTRADGTPIAIVSLTGGPTTAALGVRGPSGKIARESVIDGRALVILELEIRDPMLVVEVDALDAMGATIGSVRVAPFIQDPISCDTNTQLVGPDQPGEATFVAHLDAYLAAPLPAVCGG